MRNNKKRRKARIKKYPTSYIDESGQIDGEKLGLAMLKLIQNVLDKVKAKEVIGKSLLLEDNE